MLKKPTAEFDRIVYLFQGGGALGAYQVGVFKCLHENGYFPNWFIATSIGSINSAIIVGNAPDQCINKLEEFWQTIATKIPPAPDTINNIYMERWQHFLSAFITENIGQPGFFKPRWWNPWFSLQSSVDKLSYYDTSELRDTLTRFIDFDRINEQKIRLSMGSVRVATGKLVYFDNTKHIITPEHIMASAALPPGLPAISVDGGMYWDGGVHSNTQINLLGTDDQPINSLCFMVHLFNSLGTRPATMDDLLKRQKEISYSSHHKLFIKAYQSLHNLRHAIRILGDHLSTDQKKDPRLQKLIALGKCGSIQLARFHYQGKISDLSTKDFDFSWSSIMDHMKTGYADVAKTLKDPPWNKPHHGDIGIVIHELSDTPIDDDDPFV
ncbi:MAG: hypothetical protein A3F11_10730 [Gammaproteobacteria bacterium RIFCSPHIGHO2_12_FULL_37_14]|nr:MAG: hypothetical protein A3F11_10730 [Gammaproteobacteria bacterium RIFCSPHIGHO2_12_FULL_37_14]